MSSRQPPQEPDGQPGGHEDADDPFWGLGEDLLFPHTREFFAGIESIVRDNAAVLDNVGGNLLLHVFDVISCIVITRGPEQGIYFDERDAPIDFALMLEEWVLLDLLDPEADVAINELVDEGYLTIEGDFRIFERLLGLADKKSVIGLLGSRIGDE